MMQLRDEVSAVRRELRPILLGFVGDVRDPGHVNLRSRINWLTIQVGNNTGRRTAAQMEWIATYASQAEDHAIAVAMVHGPSSGLARLDTLAGDRRLDAGHRLQAVRAHLLELAGDRAAALAHYRAAAARATNIPERDYLLTQAARLRER